MSPSSEDLILFRAQARILLSLVAIVWIVHMINFNGWMSRSFGLRPRHPWGLVGIPCSPLLHWNTRHIAGNTEAFLILGWLVSLHGIHLFYVVTIAVALIGGLLVWAFGRDGVGAGASGVVYGYMGFLFAYGITMGNYLALLTALISAYRYRRNIVGGTYYASGMLPHPDPRLGWDAHLFGFIAGIFTAYLLSGLRFDL